MRRLNHYDFGEIKVTECGVCGACLKIVKPEHVVYLGHRPSVDDADALAAEQCKWIRPLINVEPHELVEWDNSPLVETLSDDWWMDDYWRLKDVRRMGVKS